MRWCAFLIHGIRPKFGYKPEKIATELKKEREFQNQMRFGVTISEGGLHVTCLIRGEM